MYNLILELASMSRHLASTCSNSSSWLRRWASPCSNWHWSFRMVAAASSAVCGSTIARLRIGV
eukprot:CAMPEP_0176168732 /NCGR_PEP_ID=MMETSP0120_2-20121206/86361_1 /TAXON_ID=160619 /ORGANISM="Kryptoperidinium foliaceum, Strain CCMP 1326" /LENGTH=62 /DNA_ID=CAMNT_0017506455 /DNA_START=24 /DNA_END=209 /DNA_ORIENTATION=-